MRKRTGRTAALGIILGLVLLASAAASDSVDSMVGQPVPPGRSIWTHNGSAVYLEAAGDQRRFYYQAAPDLHESAGVNPGTLLFDGHSDGSKYSGVAFLFSKKCGPISYNVAGPISADQRSVTLTGNAPIRDASCRTKGSRDDKLVFNFVFRNPDHEPQHLTQPTVLAQPLTETILDKPRESFELVAQGSTPSNEQVASTIIWSLTGPGVYQANWCIWTLYAPPLSSNEQDSLFIFSYKSIIDLYLQDKAVLARLGYPQEIWQSPLDQLRDAALAAIIDLRARHKLSGDYGALREKYQDFVERLVSALDRYRQERDPALLEVTTSACGGDFWGSFTARLAPDDGKLWLMSQFNYDWCIKMGLDPIKNSKCDLWKLALPSTVFTLGTYRYKAEWPDGVKGSDTFPELSADQAGKAVTIRKPR